MDQPTNDPFEKLHLIILCPECGKRMRMHRRGQDGPVVFECECRHEFELPPPKLSAAAR